MSIRETRGEKPVFNSAIGNRQSAFAKATADKSEI